MRHAKLEVRQLDMDFMPIQVMSGCILDMDQWNNLELYNSGLSLSVTELATHLPQYEEVIVRLWHVILRCESGRKFDPSLPWPSETKAIPHAVRAILYHLRSKVRSYPSNLPVGIDECN